MGKKIIISENDLIRVIKDSILSIQESDTEYSLEPFHKEYPRERGLKDVFGKYTEQVPNDVIRYIRKNPRLIFDRLFFEYGDKAYEYLDMAKAKYLKDDNF